MTALPERFRYIVVEGPIGAGKTSLARRLAGVSGSTLLLEDPGANPFLPGFYQDPARYALPVQLFFMFQRIDQVRDLTQADMFKHATIADFMLDKDPLFARLTLNDDELRLYQQIYAQVKPQTTSPDLVIYLQASVETLVERVKRRLDAEFAPAGYNVGFNAGEAAGQTVPHLHLHVIPRFAGDVADPRGGVRHVIPGKGNNLVPAPEAPTEGGVLVTPFDGRLRLELVRCLIRDDLDRIDLLVSFVKRSGIELIALAIGWLLGGTH